MQNREELRQKGHDSSRKTTRSQRKQKNIFRRGGRGWINIVFGPKYRPLCKTIAYIQRELGKFLIHHALSSWGFLVCWRGTCSKGSMLVLSSAAANQISHKFRSTCVEDTFPMYFATTCNLLSEMTGRGRTRGTLWGVHLITKFWISVSFFKRSNNFLFLINYFHLGFV
jgi:hypothetical protein